MDAKMKSEPTVCPLYCGAGQKIEVKNQTPITSDFSRNFGDRLELTDREDFRRALDC